MAPTEPLGSGASEIIPENFSEAPSVITMRHIPIALVILRLVLALVVLTLGLLYPDPRAFAVCLVGALVSDVLDGVVARSLGIGTPTLRRLDSAVDSIFYLCAFVAVLVNVRELVKPHVVPLILLLLVELVRYAYDYWKFKREASYHMWSSKVWGLLLFIGMYSLLVSQTGGWPVSLAIWWGIVADLEGLAISMTLRRWQPDVPTIWHAHKIRLADAWIP